MSNMTDSFESSGYHFKTGPVVEFRNLDHIHKIYQTGDIVRYIYKMELCSFLPILKKHNMLVRMKNPC